MNPRFDIATGKVMSGHHVSSKTINQLPTPLVPKQKSYHVKKTKRPKKHK